MKPAEFLYWFSTEKDLHFKLSSTQPATFFAFVICACQSLLSIFCFRLWLCTRLIEPKPKQRWPRSQFQTPPTIDATAIKRCFYLRNDIYKDYANSCYCRK